MATSNRKTPVHSGYTILNGTSSGKNDDRFDVWVEYKVTAQSIANNTSTVSAYFYAALKAGLSSTTRKNNGLDSTFSVGGVAGTVKSNASYDFTDPDNVNLLGSFSKAITHKADGSKSIAVKGSFTTESDYIAGGSISKTITLPTIARASVPTASTAAPKLGTAFTITTNRATASFTHKLTYKYVSEAGATKTGTIASNVGASYNWTPPYSIAKDIPTKTTVSCDITCATYNGSTLIGSNTVKVTLTVPNNATTRPSLSAVLSPYYTGTVAEDDPISNFGSLVSLNGKYVKAKAKVKAVITASSEYSSGIKSYAVTVGGKTITSASPTIISGIVTNFGSVEVKVVATDNRGFSNEVKQTIDVLDHARPKIKAFKVYRCFSDGAENDEGTNLYVQATRVYTKMEGENGSSDVTITQGNLCVLRLRYEAASGSYGEWIDLIPANDISMDSYSGLLKSGDTPVEISNRASYNVTIEAYDAIGGDAPVTVKFSIPTAQTDFNLNNNKAAFGKYAERDGAVQFAWDIYDKHDTPVTNGLAIYEDGTTDPDTTVDSLLLTGKNTPNGNYYYIHTDFRSRKKEDPNRVQFGLPHSAGANPAYRCFREGAWSDWIKLLIESDITNSEETITANADVAAIDSYRLLYNPILNMCFLRMSITTAAALTANTSKVVATVDDRYVTGIVQALSHAAQKGAAWLYGKNIYFRPYEALAAGTDIHITGFWML